MLPFPISSTQTDCESPVDDNLMDSIRQDLDYLDTLLALGTNVITWNASGDLYLLNDYKDPVDTITNYKEFLPTVLKVTMKRSGLTGNCVFDILEQKGNFTPIPIASISGCIGSSIQAIARVPTYNTQSISKYTPDISTQSITRAKSALSVVSVQNVGGNLWEYTTLTGPDNDWNPTHSDYDHIYTPFVGSVQMTVTISGCSNAANNGNFQIVEVNRAGHWSIVVNNASGVAEGSGGSINLNLWSYNFTNPVDASFFRKTKASQTRSVYFQGHTSGGNNGNFVPYKINQSGNNIWVLNPSGVAQAGVAGTVNSCLWTFAFSTSALSDDFSDGDRVNDEIGTTNPNSDYEFVTTAGHTSGLNNDSSHVVYSRNDGGNNVVLWRGGGTGAVQAAPAGTVQSFRWIYSTLNAVPSFVTAGDYVTTTGCTSASNNLSAAMIRTTNRASLNNYVIYNTNGVAQGGVAGSTFTRKRFIYFYSDQSANFTTDSYIEMEGIAGNTVYNKRPDRFPYKVLMINEPTATNGPYNIMIEQDVNLGVTANTGSVVTEGKSIFTSELELSPNGLGYPYPASSNLFGVTNYATPKNFISGSYTNFVGANIQAGNHLTLRFKEMHGGNPEDFTAILY